MNRHTGHLAQPSHRVAKVKIKEMGARYLFIVLYVWLEKYFSRGDYQKDTREHAADVRETLSPR